MVLFEGLSVPTTGTTLSAGPSVVVKSFTGEEFRPRLSSSLLSFQTLLPKYDPVAIEFANHVFHGMQDSAPASANDNDSIMSVIKKHIPDIVESTKSIYGSRKNVLAARKEANKKLNTLADQIMKMKVSTGQKQRPQPLKSAKRLQPSLPKTKNKTKPQRNKQTKNVKISNPVTKEGEQKSHA